MFRAQKHIDTLIIDAMRVIAPDILFRCRDKQLSPHSFSGMSYRQQLLQQLHAARGAQSILDLPNHLPRNSIHSAPIYLLLNSPNPVAMVQKMHRYHEQFFPHCKLVQINSSEQHITLECRNDNPQPPTPEEELFLCGILRYMLKQLGCQGISVEWLSARSSKLQKHLIALTHHSTPLDGNTRWRFHWQRSHSCSHIEGLDDFLVNFTDPFIKPKTQSVIERVEQLLSFDLGRKPEMAEVANMLGMSMRNMQRKMQEAGTTYSRLYSELRIKTASRLLRQSNTSLTEIALVCGFKDSAHFSREFKKTQRITPRKYRALFKTGTNVDLQPSS